MSKRKKKKRANRRNARAPVFRAYDVHHIFFQGCKWKTRWAKRLREMPYCKVILPRTTVHNAIHHYIQTVPVPKEINARMVVESLEELKQYEAIHATDSVEKRLRVLIALFECVEEPTTNALKAQLEVVSKFEKPLV